MLLDWTDITIEGWDENEDKREACLDFLFAG